MKKSISWDIKDDRKNSETFTGFLNDCLRENSQTLIKSSRAIRWVKIAPRWNYVSHDERPVGLTKSQIKSDLAIVIGLSKDEDMSKVSCLQSNGTPGQYNLINSNNYKITFESKPVIVQTYVVKRAKVASLRTPTNKVGQRTPATKARSIAYTIPSHKTAINVPKDERKALSYKQQLLKIVRDNYRGFCFSRDVRSVRLGKDENTKKSVIVMTLKNDQVDVSGLSFMKLDHKAKSGTHLNEYFFTDSHGQKVQIGKRNVKIQTRVPHVKVASLADPSNFIGKRNPVKKGSVKFFVTLPSTTPVSEKRETYCRMIRTYRSDMVNVKGVHWLRMGNRWAGLTDEECKNLTESETANATAIVIGVKHPRVSFKSVGCLKLDKRMCDFSDSFVNEYYLIDSEGKTIDYKGNAIKVQIRCIGDFDVPSLAKPSNKIRSKKSTKATKFFIPMEDDNEKKTEEVQTPKDRMVSIVQEYHKVLAKSRDVHWVKLGRGNVDKNLALLMAISDPKMDMTEYKNLVLDKSLNHNGYVNEYFLVNDDGKRVECNGQAVKVQTLVQKVKVSALGEPSNVVRQLKKTNQVLIRPTSTPTGI